MGADKDQLKKWAREEDCMAYCAKEEKQPAQRRIQEQPVRKR